MNQSNIWVRFTEVEKRLQALEEKLLALEAAVTAPKIPPKKASNG